MTDNWTRVIDNLIEIRHRKGMTQRDLAKVSGLTTSVIGRLEIKQAKPQLDTLIRVADALDCDVSIVPRTTYTFEQVEELKDEQGNIDLSGRTSLITLPDGIKANRLDLSGCTSLTALPNNLSANYLNLTGCTSLSAFGNNISADRLILRKCTSLTTLSDDIVVTERLIIENCPSLKTLPDNLTAKVIDL